MTTNKADDFNNNGVTDGKQLEIIHQLHQPRFLQTIQQVMSDYGLEKRLLAAKEQGTKVAILDIGCAEGLYLHDVAQQLESRQLLDVASCYGIDINPEMIVVAEQFARLSNPPRPYIYFYTHDARQPLENSPIYKVHKQHEFDFIFSIHTLELLPDARQHLGHFYAALKPGGVIYLRSIVPHRGDDGWLPIHPALEAFNHAFYGGIAKLNPEGEVAEESANWLQEFGAEQVWSEREIVNADKSTPRGALHLRTTISILHEKLAPLLIKQGKLTQEEYDKLWARVANEPAGEKPGQTGIIHTLARKPDDQN